MTGATVTSRVSRGHVHIAVAGEVDLFDADTVEREIAAAIPNQATTVSIDLGAVRYLDSAGLRILFGLVSRLAVLQIGLELVAPKGSPVRRVIELSGLAPLVALSPPA